MKSDRAINFKVCTPARLSPPLLISPPHPMIRPADFKILEAKGGINFSASLKTIGIYSLKLFVCSCGKERRNRKGNTHNSSPKHVLGSYNTNSLSRPFSPLFYPGSLSSPRHCPRLDICTFRKKEKIRSKNWREEN